MLSVLLTASDNQRGRPLSAPASLYDGRKLDHKNCNPILTLALTIQECQHAPLTTTMVQKHRSVWRPHWPGEEYRAN